MADLETMRQKAIRAKANADSFRPGILKFSYHPEAILALIACAEALQIDVTAELAAVEEWNKLYPHIPWKENHAVIERLKMKQAALAQLEKAP